VQHFRILRSPDRHQYYLWNDGPHFNSVNALVAHYRTTPVNKNGHSVLRELNFVSSLSVLSKMHECFGGAGPAVTMFKMYSRTGSPISGWLLFCKLQGDSRIAFILPLIAMLTKETRNAANRCFLLAYNAAKCNCGRHPGPHSGSLQHSPDPLAGFKGATSPR